MAKILSFGKCSRLYKYILGSVIFKFLENFSLGYKSENGEKEFSLYGFIPVLYNYNCIKSLFGYIGFILFGFLFYLISKKKIKKKISDETTNNLLPKGMIHNKSTKKTKNDYIPILIFCLLFVFHIEIKKILYLLNFQSFNIWGFDILFMLIFLKSKFVVYNYRHQKYSIIFIVSTSTFLLLLSSFFPFKKSEGNEYINSYSVANKLGSYFISIPLFLIFIALSCAYSYSRVLGKSLMQIDFISPYLLIIFLGIIGFILASLVGFIFHEFSSTIGDIFDYKDDFFDYFRELKETLKDNKKYEFYFEILVVTPIYSFIIFMQNLFEILTVYYLNPLYILITNNLCYGVIQLISFIETYEIDEGFLVLCHFLCEELSEFFALLGYSVYLEIIELGFWGLDENLRRKISSRSEIEFRISSDAFKENKDDQDDQDSDDEEDEEKDNEGKKKNGKENKEKDGDDKQ